MLAHARKFRWGQRWRTHSIARKYVFSTNQSSVTLFNIKFCQCYSVSLINDLKRQCKHCKDQVFTLGVCPGWSCCVCCLGIIICLANLEDLSSVLLNSCKNAGSGSECALEIPALGSQRSFPGALASSLTCWVTSSHCLKGGGLQSWGWHLAPGLHLWVL